MIEPMADFMWSRIADQLRASAPSTRLAIAKASLPHPRQAGANVSVGLPVGQLADYRFPPDAECGGVHVHEYPGRWVAHLDQVHPACNIAEHVRRDAPDAWSVGGAVLGAAAGLALGKSAGAALAGAGLGLLLAIATRDPSDPR